MSISCTFQSVSAAAHDQDLKHLNLRDHLFTPAEQSVLEDVLQVLKPMKIATVLVSGKKQPSASKILPTLAKLRKEINVNELDSQLVKEMKMNITDNLNKRYTDEKVYTFLLKATFFDPRYKSLNSIAKPLVLLKTKEAIREMCIQFAEKKLKDTAEYEAESPLVKMEPEEQSLPVAACSSESPPPKKMKTETDYDDWLDDVVCLETENAKPSVSALELINEELDKYDAESQIKGNPLEWWKARQSSMPHLAEVASYFMCSWFLSSL